MIPSCTIANATSGWIPTITVSAPRRLVMWASVRNERAAKESMTSKRRDVDDDALRPEPADLFHQVVLQPQRVAVAQRRLDRRDQVGALLEDRDGHRAARPFAQRISRAGSPDRVTS